MSTRDLLRQFAEFARGSTPQKTEPERAAEAREDQLPAQDSGRLQTSAVGGSPLSAPPSSWNPPGSPCEVHGIWIPGGMLYVGRGLRSIGQYGPEVDPALVDPSLPVRPPRSGTPLPELPYWPSYSELEPEARFSYLHWLADGRRDKAASIGLVFLFFYGLERRLLYDDSALGVVTERERQALLLEIDELLLVYGQQGSFRRYATELRDTIRICSGELPHLEIPPFPPPDRGAGLPLPLQAQIGRYVALGEPIPAPWALAWVASSPEARLRTAALRAPALFRELFLRRFGERFADRGGLIVHAKSAPLTVTPRTASSSFRGITLTMTSSDCRRLGGFEPEKQVLHELLDSVTEELAAYSRAISPSSSAPLLAAIAQLPPELGRFETCPEREALRAVVNRALGDGPSCVIPAADLRALWRPIAAGRWGSKDDQLFARLLEQDGIGVEPDLRFEGDSLGESKSAVLFRFFHGEERQLSSSFRLAALLLHLGALVAGADDAFSPEEEAALADHLATNLSLTPEESVRLSARLRLLMTDPPQGTGGLKKRLSTLALTSRATIGSVLVALAGADGCLSAQEIKALRRAYLAMGLSRESLNLELASLGGANAAPSFETDLGLPTKTSLRLDPALIAVGLAEADRAAGLLAAVFTDMPEADVAREAIPDDEPPYVDPDAVLGLDSAHSALLIHLSRHSTWPRKDLDRAARALGLMLDGALETLNGVAREKAGEPLVEGDDPIDVYLDVVSELTG